MKVHFNSYNTNRSISGALYYYSEVSRILSTANTELFSSCNHNFFHLVNSSESDQARFIRSLRSDDIVVSNIGAIAHIYHYLREKYNGNFRIIRDVQTSTWSGFWLQEALAAPMTRTGDLIIFPSEFCRQYFLHLFPDSLTISNTRVCYPISNSLPLKAPTKNHDRTPQIGYIGRFSDDKNIKQVLSIFARFQNHNKNAHLHLAGPISRSSTFNSRQAIINHLRTLGVSKANVSYHGKLPYARIWEFFSKIHTFIFPGLANVESLGRVILEASRAGVPSVCANYAAAPELVPRENICNTRYNLNTKFEANGIFSFGSVDEQSALDKIENACFKDGDISLSSIYRPDYYLKIIYGDEQDIEIAPLTPTIKAFINSMVITPGLSELSKHAPSLGHEILSYSNRFNDFSLPGMLSVVFHSLLNEKYRKSEGLHHLTRKLRPSFRMNISNVLLHCKHLQFAPKVSLEPSTTDAPLLLADENINE
jgi:glycosyltransferase involved in cell wall biosynthesis